MERGFLLPLVKNIESVLQILFCSLNLFFLQLPVVVSSLCPFSLISLKSLLSSSYCCRGKFFFSEAAFTLNKVLKNAIISSGILKLSHVSASYSASQNLLLMLKFIDEKPCRICTAASFIMLIFLKI